MSLIQKKQVLVFSGRKNFRIRIFLVGVISSVIFLVGCGTIVKESRISEAFSKSRSHQYELENVIISVQKESKYMPIKVVPDMLKAYLVIELVKLNASKASTTPNVVRLNIDIVDYNDRGGFNRFFWGPFYSSDYIESQVVLVDGSSGETIGNFRIRSEDAWGMGIDSLSKIHAKKIIKMLQHIDSV